MVRFRIGAGLIAFALFALTLCTSSIALATGGASTWGINANQDIWRWNGSGWQQIPGKLTNVAVGSDGVVWGVTGSGVIYRRVGEQWQSVPGALKQVSVGNAQNVWGVNANQNIWRWNGSGWQQIPGKLTNVAVGSDGAVWGVNSAGNVFRRVGEQWQQVQGGLVQVAVAASPAATAVTAVPLNVTATLSPVAIPTTTLVISGGPGIPLQPQTTPPPSAPSLQPEIKVGGISDLGKPPVPKSHSECGGAGQALCGSVPAMLVRAASIACPAGSFPDLGKSSCWSCPSGYERSPDAVDSDRACQRRDTRVGRQLSNATFRAPLCPEGSFYDPIRGGECYSCPPGYNRSAAHIDAPNACYIPAGEKLSAATRHRKTAWAWDCKGGTFWDGWDGGGCWSCPSGYVRTANHIKGNNACSAYVAEQQARATVKQRAQCRDGEFFDAKIPGAQNPARGGGCWTCPQAWTRTIFPVDGNQACEKTASFVFARATRVKAMTCEPDEIFDLINANVLAVRYRLDAQNRYLASIGQRTVTVPPVAAGGTCWKCAPGTKRSAFPVYQDNACDSTGIKWVSASYPHPGLFGLDGAEEVALALVQDGTVINTMVDALAKAKRAPVADVRRAVWKEISATPQSSDLLKAAVLYHLVKNVLPNPARATLAEARLLNSVKTEIVNFHTFMAQDALDAYHAWKAGAPTRQSRYAKSQLQTEFDTGEVPPDFEQITAETIASGLTTGAAVSTAGTIAMMDVSVFKQVFPYATRVSWQSAADVAKFTNLATRISAEVSEGATRLSAGLTMEFLGVGPQLIITMAAEALAVAIEQQIDIANAEPKLLAGLATARVSPDLQRMLGTRQGTAEFQDDWTFMMSNIGPNPKNIAPFAAYASSRVN